MSRVYLRGLFSEGLLKTVVAEQKTQKKPYCDSAQNILFSVNPLIVQLFGRIVAVLTAAVAVVRQRITLYFYESNE